MKYLNRPQLIEIAYLITGQHPFYRTRKRLQNGVYSIKVHRCVYKLGAEEKKLSKKLRYGKLRKLIFQYGISQEQLIGKKSLGQYFFSPFLTLCQSFKKIADLTAAAIWRGLTPKRLLLCTTQLHPCLKLTTLVINHLLEMWFHTSKTNGLLSYCWKTVFEVQLKEVFKETGINFWIYCNYSIKPEFSEFLMEKFMKMLLVGHVNFSLK